MIYPNSSFENKLRQLGYGLIAGADEAGRGPLAGPVVGAAVILPAAANIKGLDDSKKLTPKKRAEVFARILDQAPAVAIGVSDIDLIARVNILWASIFAMREATLALNPLPDFVLVDGKVKLSCPMPEKTIVGGDGRVNSIAAASIVAKVTRDRIMQHFHELYPQYG
ncbi:MAG: ribonuclease HII, partial [Candidatus Margulisiibacteriota bacterium]